MIFTLFNSDGSFDRTIQSDFSSELESIIKAYQGIAIYGDLTGYYLDENYRPVKIPEKPSEFHVWNKVTKTWNAPSNVKDLVWEEIKAERDRRKYDGVHVADHWFHSDNSSRIQQMALKVMGSLMPAGIRWKTLTGDFVDMTPDLAAQIFTAVTISDQTIFGISERHRVAMLASDTPWSYDFSMGWPQSYTDWVNEQAAVASAANTISATTTTDVSTNTSGDTTTTDASANTSSTTSTTNSGANSATSTQTTTL